VEILHISERMIRYYQAAAATFAEDSKTGSASGFGNSPSGSGAKTIASPTSAEESVITATKTT